MCRIFKLKGEGPWALKGLALAWMVNWLSAAIITAVFPGGASLYVASQFALALSAVVFTLKRKYPIEVPALIVLITLLLSNSLEGKPLNLIIANIVLSFGGAMAMALQWFGAKESTLKASSFVGNKLMKVKDSSKPASIMAFVFVLFVALVFMIVNPAC